MNGKILSFPRFLFSTLAKKVADLKGYFKTEQPKPSNPVGGSLGLHTTTPRASLNKKQREAWLNENWRYGVLTFRYTDGVHGNIVKVKDKRGDTIAGIGCRGGGYDMTGTCLGQLIEKLFPEQIQRLDSRDFYGVNHYNAKRKGRAAWQAKASKHTRTTLNGACGMHSMRAILERIGFKLEQVNETRTARVDTTTYILKTA